MIIIKFLEEFKIFMSNIGLEGEDNGVGLYLL
jgi:hypothetical protein